MAVEVDEGSTGVGVRREKAGNEEVELLMRLTVGAVVELAGRLCDHSANNEAVLGSAEAALNFRMSAAIVPVMSSVEGRSRDSALMDKKARDTAEVRLRELSIRSAREDTSCSGSPQSFRTKMSGDSKGSQRNCRSLVSLCIGKLGCHLEDIIDEVDLFAPACPAPIKASLLAIARRRGLLSDALLVALADDSWDYLDVSGSDVTDASLQKVAKVCSRLLAVDISRCSRLSPLAVRSLVEHCPDIHTLRWGGTSMSNTTAKLALGYILPKLNLNEEAEDSWEELETKTIGKGVQALRWLVWDSIDNKSRERLEMECPRVVVNPRPFCKGFQHLSVPWEAHPGSVLDAHSVEGIDPKTWAVITTIPRTVTKSIDGNGSPVLSVAERFKLAFVSRDERLAPKRAKNMRQNQRRSEKARLNSDTEAKSRAWAGLARKALKGFDG